LWKYIEEERSRSRDDYRRCFIDIKGRNKGNFDNHFKQYIAACERDKDKDLDFKAYIQDADDPRSDAGEPNNSSTYITCNRLPIHRQNANLTRLHIDSLTDSVTDSVK